VFPRGACPGSRAGVEMRATLSLITIAVTVVAAAGVLGSDAQRMDPSEAPRLLAAPGTGEHPGAEWPSGFDGRLWADPASGCFHLSPPEGSQPLWGTAEADLEVVPVPEPGDEAQPPAPAPEPLPDEGWGMTRGPWPLCDHPGTMVQLAPDSP
jgi:hypothetical protein